MLKVALNFIFMSVDVIISIIFSCKVIKIHKKFNSSNSTSKLSRDSKYKIDKTSTDIGLISNLGKVLFTKYVLPFEISSVLFLSAMIGAIVIGKKEHPNEFTKADQ